MCPNRVEELESRVQELEASVEGLTDELVECKVRLRELENAVDDDLSFVPEEPEQSSVGQKTDGDTTKPEATDTEDKTEEQGSSEIIIA